MKLNKLLILALVSLIGSVSVQAKFYEPAFERSFDKQIKRHDLAVVHFNPYPKSFDEPALDRMIAAFKSLAKRDRYRDADVAFIEVNLEAMPDLADDYDIAVPDWQSIEESAEEALQQDAAQPEDFNIEKSQQSTIMLFKEGKPFKEKGKVINRVGFMTKSEIEDFIAVYFASFIDSIIAEQKQEERELEQSRAQREAQLRATQKPIIVKQPVVTQPVVTQPVVTRRVYVDDYYPRRRRYWRGPGVGIDFGWGRGGIGWGRGGIGWGGRRRGRGGRGRGGAVMPMPDLRMKGNLK